jgi:hypothetical protein
VHTRWVGTSPPRAEGSKRRELELSTTTTRDKHARPHSQSRRARSIAQPATSRVPLRHLFWITHSTSLSSAAVWHGSSALQGQDMS